MLAVYYLRPRGSIQVLGDFFRLTYVENTGAAFGQWQDQSAFLGILSLCCIGLLAVIYLKSSNALERAGLVLILSGAAGNCFDRIYHGYVIDFLDFEFFDIHIESFKGFAGFHLERWPVFNFADTCICIGTGLLLGFLFFYRQVPKNTACS